MNLRGCFLTFFCRGAAPHALVGLRHSSPPTLHIHPGVLLSGICPAVQLWAPPLWDLLVAAESPAETRTPGRVTVGVRGSGINVLVRRSGTNEKSWLFVGWITYRLTSICIRVQVCGHAPIFHSNLGMFPNTQMPWKNKYMKHKSSFKTRSGALADPQAPTGVTGSTASTKSAHCSVDIYFFAFIAAWRAHVMQLLALRSQCLGSNRREAKQNVA